MIELEEHMLCLMITHLASKYIERAFPSLGIAAQKPIAVGLELEVLNSASKV